MLGSGLFTAILALFYQPLINGGDLAVTWCFVFLFLAVAGGGPWSLDNALFRRRATV